MQLEAVPFARTHTAHAMGAQIGKVATESQGIDLYRALGNDLGGR
jgi:hypothetical protein